MTEILFSKQDGFKIFIPLCSICRYAYMKVEIRVIVACLERQLDIRSQYLKLGPELRLYFWSFTFWNAIVVHQGEAQETACRSKLPGETVSLKLMHVIYLCNVFLLPKDLV